MNAVQVAAGSKLDFCLYTITNEGGKEWTNSMYRGESLYMSHTVLLFVWGLPHFDIKGSYKTLDTILNDLLRTEDHQPESKQYQGTIQ
jgi:hypothetical protein